MGPKTHAPDVAPRKLAGEGFRARPFPQAKPELLTPRQRQMMHTVALGETSGSAVADSFLRYFRTNPELAAFFGTWFTEELNHFIGYHMYLRQMGEPWPAARGMAVAETDVLP